MEFTPKPFYEPVTDSLIYYFKEERSYAKWINKYLTIFLSIKDNTPVGIELNGFKHYWIKNL